MSDTFVFLVVVGSRFFVPLLIPRIPLPAILAALVIDAADQTIFQQFTDLDLTSYQSYDKALDIFYLTIAFVATMKNWSNPVAFQVARFLWYYRLVGVTAFELTEQRWMLLVFANTFEYFFIFHEAVRTRWNATKLSRRAVIGAAAAIWIFIKLPQEWWIHVAQLDFTDFMKEDVFGVTATDSWGTALTNRPAVTAALALALIAVVVGARVGARRLPPADWRFTLDAEVVNTKMGWTALPEPGRWHESVVGWATFEKVVLLTLVSVIFANMLPVTDVDGVGILVGVSILVVADAAIALWRGRRELEWRSTFARFVALSIVNLGLIAVYSWIANRGEDRFNLVGGLFFAMLLTLIIVLFDRYRRVRSARLAALGLPDDADPRSVVAGAVPAGAPSG